MDSRPANGILPIWDGKVKVNIMEYETETIS